MIIYYCINNIINDNNNNNKILELIVLNMINSIQNYASISDDTLNICYIYLTFIEAPLNQIKKMRRNKMKIIN